jgi:hypothetical protein
VSNKSFTFGTFYVDCTLVVSTSISLKLLAITDNLHVSVKRAT